MKYSQARVDAIVTRHEELIEAVENYVRAKFPNERRGDVRISNGAIEEEVNTSCHCHPEYSWVYRSLIEDFVNWYNR